MQKLGLVRSLKNCSNKIGKIKQNYVRFKCAENASSKLLYYFKM